MRMGVGLPRHEILQSDGQADCPRDIGRARFKALRGLAKGSAFEVDFTNHVPAKLVGR